MAFATPPLRFGEPLAAFPFPPVTHKAALLLTHPFTEQSNGDSTEFTEGDASFALTVSDTSLSATIDPATLCSGGASDVTVTLGGLSAKVWSTGARVRHRLCGGTR